MAEIHPITLPKWGIEMSEGTVATWHLAVGASAEKGTELVDIETEKIVNTLDLEVGGTLRRQLAQPGDVLPVGALIAVLADASVPDSAIDAFVAGYKPIDVSFEPKEEGSVASQSSPRHPGESRDDEGGRGEAAKSSVPVSPPLDPAILAARNEAAHASPLARRLANKLGIDLSSLTGTGQKGRISQEDVEKAAAARGTVAPVPPAPEPVPTGPEPHASPIAEKIARKLGMTLHGIKGTGARGRVSLADVQAAAKARGLISEPAQVATPSPAAGPAARKLAGDLGVDLSTVTPTGPKGHATKQDVRDAADRATVPTAEVPAYDLLPVTGMRRAIATALVNAKQNIPHFYLTSDVTVDALLSFREQLNARASSPRKLSVNDLLIKAAALALMEVPDVNVHWADDGIRRFRSADISVAVAVDGGLLTPVVRGADRLDPWAIGARAADLADRARKRTLAKEDISGGSFTISNLGMFGIRQFQAIINPPQGAILAVGTTRREARETAEGGVAFASVMSLTLSCDHRAVDGALGAKFLAALGRRLEDPIGLVL
ncbi:2-oxo acid dehydrogenase subunit E2 [Niveispirillum cyanobacteriorum]|nr:2-oxo acid dehydrogenase subunit E2 [Niveispirillum cyanobacteriorum]GGE81633.1 acetyltransferase component of pyruvate dehydrogenase complex [Niveispirillum cyanobacteriorum]